MAESEEELKSLLMKVKEESERADSLLWLMMQKRLLHYVQASKKLQKLNLPQELNKYHTYTR